MSAFILDRKHIAYLVDAALSRAIVGNSILHWGNGCALRGGDAAAADRLGKLLWDENVRSVQHRYSDDKPENLPGPIGCDFEYGEHGFHLEEIDIDPMQVLKACNCYEYQTCERADWEASEAYRFISALKSAAVSSLPGYKVSKWSIA